MNYKKLGKSGVEVSELILGCWAMGGDYFGATEDESSLEALQVSYENGVNTFDTAEIYGSGRSERVVGEAARRIGREKVKIISKVFKPSMAHDKMVKACEDSLSRLGTDYLDVYFLHYPIPEEEVSIQERMETMTELKKAGKIRAIGMSTHNPRVALLAAKSGVVDVIMFSVNPAYDLLPPTEDVDSIFEKETYENALSSTDPERQELYSLCESRGVALTCLLYTSPSPRD